MLFSSFSFRVRRIATLLTLLGIPCFAQAGTICFATDASRPPYSFLDETYRPEGFEVAVAREICTRMGADCSFVSIDRESLTLGLEAGQYDAALAALDSDRNPGDKIVFSDPYLNVTSVPHRSACCASHADRHTHDRKHTTYRIAVRATDRELKIKIDAALAAMKEDGTHEALVSQYLDTDVR